jgi:hypothetical protein
VGYLAKAAKVNKYNPTELNRKEKIPFKGFARIFKYTIYLDH